MPFNEWHVVFRKCLSRNDIYRKSRHAKHHPLLAGLVFGVAAFAMTHAGVGTVNVFGASDLEHAMLAGNFFLGSLELRMMREGLINRTSDEPAIVETLWVASAVSSLDCFVVGAGSELENLSSPALGSCIGALSSVSAVLGVWLASHVQRFTSERIACFSGLVLILLAIARAF